MHINLILGLSADGCLSLNQQDDLSWLSPRDKANFKKITIKSGAVLMGKNTYLSLVNFGVFPLPGRLNFVLTHKQIDDRGGIFLAGKPKEVIKQISASGATSLSLIGGRSVYQDFLDSNLVSEIWLTQSSKILLDLRKDCDSPGFDSGEKKVVLSERGEAVASLKEEKLVFTGRAEPGDCRFLGKASKNGEIKFDIAPHLKNFKLISEEALNNDEILKHFTKASSN